MIKETTLVDKAKALRESAIGLAKEQLLEEISPKMAKLFDQKLEEVSRKTIREEDEDADIEVKVGDEDEAEIDLDDLAKELETDDETEDDGDLEDRVSAIEKDLEDVKDNVEELVGGEEGAAAAESDEEIEIEDDESEEESEEGLEEDEEEIQETVDVAITDDDVKIDILNTSGEEYVDIIDDSEDFSDMDAGPSMEKDDEEVIIVDDEADDDDDEQSEDELEEVRRRVRERRMRNSRPRIKECSVVRRSGVIGRESNEVKVLKQRLNKERIESIKAKRIMNEVTSLNKKLTLVSRIFAQYNLSKQSKIKVLEMFDKANTLKEAFDVYKNITRKLSQKMRIKEAKIITESNQSLKDVARPTGSLPQDRILEVSRLKKLAGITE